MTAVLHTHALNQNVFSCSQDEDDLTRVEIWLIILTDHIIIFPALARLAAAADQ